MDFEIGTSFNAYVLFENNISTNGESYLVIFGKHVNGYFCCIPNRGWGCEMAEYDDIWYNANQLRSCGASQKAAENIAEAIKHSVEQWLEIDENPEQETTLEPEPPNEEVKFVPAKTLSGWHWRQYDDGSGCLESPDGERYFEYDINTQEYIDPRTGKWNFMRNYPGSTPFGEFKAYAENYVSEKILSKDKSANVDKSKKRRPPENLGAR